MIFNKAHVAFARHRLESPVYANSGYPGQSRIVWCLIWVCSVCLCPTKSLNGWVCKILITALKAIGIINFAKHFQNFIADTIVWFLNSKLDLNLSCAKDFRNRIWCILRKLLALIIFQRSLLK